MQHQENRLRELRKVSRMKRADLAEMLGVDAEDIKAWEKFGIPPWHVEACARVFSVSRAWMADEEIR